MFFALAMLPALHALVRAGEAGAQVWPARPVHIVVGFTGGPPDTVARITAAQLAMHLGQPVVVDTRAGANGQIAADAVARAAPDGHTLLVTSASFAVNPSIYRKLPFDVLRDFAPVTSIAQYGGFILAVNPAVPAKTMREFVTLARRPDSRLAFGSPGIGNTVHLAMAVFVERTGAVMTHVPYKGGDLAVSAMLAGDIQAMMLPPSQGLSYYTGGKLRALGYSAAARLPQLAEVPTFAEAGFPDIDLGGPGWYGLFAPAHTPAAVIDRLQQEVAGAVATSLVRERLASLGLEPVASRPEAFRADFERSVRRYGEIVHLAGIEPE